MSVLHEECGIAAIYHLPGREISPLCPDGNPNRVSYLLPRMLLDIQNRGQLAAGITTYNKSRNQLIDTRKDIGSVTEVFRLSHRGKAQSIMEKYAGNAGIGHVRYATCGQDDRSFAQPFERHHLQKHKWFSFAFNGQLANYSQLRDKMLLDGDYHFARETDTEIIMHQFSREFAGEGEKPLLDVMKNVSAGFDGAYSLAFINARGELLLARDPLGIKPLCYAFDGSLLAAASESVALVNIGFAPHEVRSLPPGGAVTIVDGQLDQRPFSQSQASAHCFFEWIYFANVASTLDDRSVYLTRTALGVELATLEKREGRVTIDEDTIVVPVPDTSKAAADSMAFHLGIPSREGLIRNRYSGRTFIQGSGTRREAAETKYTPLPEVLGGKRIFLVEDSIVRSTTMRVLLDRIRADGNAREIHVRVACPPIVAPCFYGIDMSTVDELFAPRFMAGREPSEMELEKMAESLGSDSIRYLPIDSIARSIEKPQSQLCQACISGEYPTACGQELYQMALEQSGEDQTLGRTYEKAPAGS